MGGRSAAMALIGIVAIVVTGVAVTRSPALGTPAPSAAASGPGLVDAIPEADPLPWTSVSWRRLVLAAGPAMVPGHTRIDGLVRGAPGLVGWGRTATPGRNQFDDMGAAYLSATGDAWTVVPIDDGVGPRDTSEIHLVVAGPAGLLAVGGVCCDEERPATWTSHDGTAWIRAPVDPKLAAVDVVDVLATDSGFIAAGNAAGQATILRSSDGIDWDAVDPAGLGPGGLSDLTVTRDGYLAVGWSDDGVTHDGATWRSADGRTWARVDEPLLAGDQDTDLWRAVPFAPGEYLTGNEGPHAERIRCEQLLGQRATTAGPTVDPGEVVDLSCGWGLETQWLRSAGGPLRRLPVRWLGGVAPPPGSFVGSPLIMAGGPGLVGIGEAEGEVGLRLWTSRDGQSWEQALPDQPFGVGASITGFVVDVRRLVAVGEEWDPDGNRPGVPAVWLGIAE